DLLAEVDPGFGDGQAADQVLREIVRLEVRQRAPDLVDERHADRVLGGRDLDQPATPLVARGQRLREQVAEQEDLDAALTHLVDEPVVLVLRALDPQDVVEQQLVMVRGGQSLEAEPRPVDHALAELAHFRIGTEVRHHPSARLALARATWVPAVPSTIWSICSRLPIAERLPVLSTNRMAAATVAPIERAPNSEPRGAVAGT